MKGHRVLCQSSLLVPLAYAGTNVRKRPYPCVNLGAGTVEGSGVESEARRIGDQMHRRNVAREKVEFL